MQTVYLGPLLNPDFQVRLWISKKLQGDGDAAGPGLHSEKQGLTHRSLTRVHSETT